MTEEEFYENLKRKVPDYPQWNKPAHALWQAIVEGEDEVRFDPVPLRSSENFSAVVSHFALDATIWYLYETYRKFPNGQTHYRPRFVQLEPGGEYLPVALTESRKGRESNLPGRAFSDETRWLLDWNRLAIYFRPAELHESVAFKGFLSLTRGTVGHLYACVHEFAGGVSISTVDEYGVETLLRWETEHAMRLRRTKDFTPPSL